MGVKYIWKRDKLSHTLVTDSLGRIKLGPLAGAIMVNIDPVESTEENLKVWFNLWDEVSAITTEQIFKIEGESFRLPRLPQFEEKGVEFSLQKVSNSMKTVIEDCSKKCH